MNPFTKSEPANAATQEREGLSRMTTATPLANVVESADGYTLQAEMPGVSRDGLTITVDNDELTIVGRRGAYESPGVLLYGESRPADFRRSFEIDPSIDSARISAKMEDGVLTLHLPKAEAVKPRRIAITD